LGKQVLLSVEERPATG